MNILDNFILLATDSCRSRAYIDVMFNNKLKPAFAVILKINSLIEKSEELLENQFFKNNIPLEDMLAFYDINYKTLTISDINDNLIFQELGNLKQPYVIFSIPGYILGKGYFKCGKKYLHIHPGKLPDYRGSTPMYYSILEERKLAVSAIFLEERIDEGPILRISEFDLPEDPTIIDTIYDPWMRANLLVETLKLYCIHKEFNVTNQQKDAGEIYYVIHPVMKCLSINAIVPHKNHVREVS